MGHTPSESLPEPVVLRCRACRQPVTVHYEALPDWYVVRHGDGEARRAFTFDQIINTSDLADWIATVHAYERATR